MKLQIGERLRMLRSEMGVTQEQLSEALDVSAQSVSRWELGICYPDIELLPAIANYFGVTMDELVGMDRIRGEDRRAEIFRTAQEYERRGEWNLAIAFLREALKTHPGDDGILTELALALSMTEDRKDRADAIAISEKVLSRSTNQKLRSTAMANLCFLYKAAGQYEKAVALGKTLPHIWESREMLMPDLVADDERGGQVSRSLDIAAQVLHDVISGEKIRFSLGYKPEKNVPGEALAAFLDEHEW